MQDLSFDSWNSSFSSRNCREILFSRVYNERSEKASLFLPFPPLPLAIVSRQLSSGSSAVWTCLPYLDLLRLCLVNLSCLVHPPFLCCQLLKLTCALPFLPDFTVYFPTDTFLSPRLVNSACFAGLCFSKYLPPRIVLAWPLTSTGLPETICSVVLVRASACFRSCPPEHAHSFSPFRDPQSHDLSHVAGIKSLFGQLMLQLAAPLWKGVKGLSFKVLYCS